MARVTLVTLVWLLHCQHMDVKLHLPGSKFASLWQLIDTRDGADESANHFMLISIGFTIEMSMFLHWERVAP